MIGITHFQSPIGMLTITVFNETVGKISFGNDSKNSLNKLYRHQLDGKIVYRSSFTQHVEKQILSFLDGRCHSLDFPVVHINTPFRKRVLEVERKIPYGETRSYGEIAKMIESPNGSRAVGCANSRNPLPLYFPCHRIILSNGKLGGYGGGLKVKKYLLDLESSLCSKSYDKQ